MNKACIQTIVVSTQGTIPIGCDVSVALVGLYLGAKSSFFRVCRDRVSYHHKSIRETRPHSPPTPSPGPIFRPYIPNEECVTAWQMIVGPRLPETGVDA
jgi:hypothetical protein